MNNDINNERKNMKKLGDELLTNLKDTEIGIASSYNKGYNDAVYDCYKAINTAESKTCFWEFKDSEYISSCNKNHKINDELVRYFEFCPLCGKSIRIDTVRIKNFVLCAK